MKPYLDMTEQELQQEYAILAGQYEAIQAQKLDLNMARGKPGKDQLQLSMPMLDMLASDSRCFAEDGLDCRNYGELCGIKEARALFGEYLGVEPNETLIAGSSSLTFMYDTMARAMLTGVRGSDKPWKDYSRIRFICPVPGYDRHFAICEFLGIEMIPVPMDEHGPDMDMVERLVREDESVKGIWCVPKYSNPSGITYADDVVRRLAAMNTKAQDFRIFWDNAYAHHFLSPETDTPLLNILDECKKAGNPDRPYLFGSTNKITFPGAGVAFFAASPENIIFTEHQLAKQAISWDKLNMLRHVRFLKNMDGIRAHMSRHAELLKPRFDIVIKHLEEQLIPLGLGSFSRPAGGYFVAYQAPRGCAKQIVARCKAAGIILTDAGATHPYGSDPDDSYIRIAPSFPSCEELHQAMDVFCTVVKLTAIDNLIC